jgi:glyoxylase-like metal-dependent hydrolase (beta-lactamase superfamily II)/8-oxo-dGTP pyrophosphatase MutT (NUDIX family)
VTAPHVTPPDARTAASLLLLRDGVDGLEVLMLRRAERSGDQRSGAAVFPGGVLDARDREAHGHCHGPSDAEFSARMSLPEGGLDYAVAALRETFEEVGLLLACDASGLAWQPGPGQVDAMHPWRQRLNAGEVGAADFCRHHGLRLDTRGLAYYSHWLTPPGQPKRWDTRFFCALAPQEQAAQADLGEALELMWLGPRLTLLPVTRHTLQQLSRFGRAADAHGEALGRRDIRVTMPRRVLTPRGIGVVLPDDLAYAEVGRLDPLGRGDVRSTIEAGRVVQLSPHVRRVTAPNAGPMTGPGTNSYLVAGDAGWTVIDPGPASAEHLRALLEASEGRIARILVTHTHKDHSPLAAALAHETGAPVAGRVADHPMWQDSEFAPHEELADGQRLALGEGLTLRVIHTPGHASNHLCYLLEEERTLFTGDHVMAGSTVVINPPDGDMGAYLRSLRSLLDVPLDWLAPGHGFLVAQPHDALRGLIAHRLRREAKVLAAWPAADVAAIDELLPRVYDDVPATLHAMARRSLLAHLLKLQQDGAIRRLDEDRWQR